MEPESREILYCGFMVDLFSDGDQSSEHKDPSSGSPTLRSSHSCHHCLRGTQLVRQQTYNGRQCNLHTHQRHNTENSKQTFPEKELHGLSPKVHIHVSSHHRSAYSATGKYVDRSWEWIIAHRNMNVEIRTEATQFFFHKWDFRCSA